jgi:hypothetical protein
MRGVNVTGPHSEFFTVNFIAHLEIILVFFQARFTPIDLPLPFGSLLVIKDFAVTLGGFKPAHMPGIISYEIRSRAPGG